MKSLIKKINDWYHVKIKKDSIMLSYDLVEPKFKTYGRVFIVDLIKCCLLLGLIIPCGIEYLIIGILKAKGLNKELFRVTLKND